jgi:5-methylcytosine-specific restriction endonuclease McrA
MVNAIKASRAKRRKRLLAVGDRDGWICWICRRPVDQDLAADDPLHASLDHVIPRNEGGSDDSSNLRLSHHRCNHERDNQAHTGGDEAG